MNQIGLDLLINILMYRNLFLFHGGELNIKIMEITRNDKIFQLFRAHGSDKNDHGYAEPYAINLPNTCRSLLEIGVAKGASALAWEELYGADLDLHLLDLFMDPDHVSVKWCKRHGFETYEGSQSDSSLLASIRKKFEVVIDDGSHNAQDQLISFKHLFLNNVQSGGLYVIEDLHCNKEAFYWGGEVKVFEDTPLYMLKVFILGNGIQNVYFNEGESETFVNIIDRVSLYNDQIAFIYKK